jgi:hypothetical protein
MLRSTSGAGMKWRRSSSTRTPALRSVAMLVRSDLLMLCGLIGRLAARLTRQALATSRVGFLSTPCTVRLVTADSGMGRVETHQFAALPPEVFSSAL